MNPENILSHRIEFIRFDQKQETESIQRLCEYHNNREIDELLIKRNQIYISQIDRFLGNSELLLQTEESLFDSSISRELQFCVRYGPRNFDGEITLACTIYLLGSQTKMPELVISATGKTIETLVTRMRERVDLLSDL
jgi:hypothetical protein